MIPAEAVEAAAKAYRREFPYDENEAYIVKLILEAAHPVLLAELRKAHEALERVEAITDEMDETAALRAVNADVKSYYGSRIRAAVAAAKGDEQ